MDAGAMREALEAIRQEAEKLLAQDLPADIEPKINLILSIAEYQFDLRTEQETRE